MKAAQILQVNAPVFSPGEQVCLGVVVPAFNEEATIAETLDRVLAQPCVQEVVVVDDGSTDETAAQAGVYASKDSRVTLIQHRVNRGKGASIRTGLRRITASIIIVQDADLECDPGDYPRLLEPILRGEVHVVYGSRFMPGTNPWAPWWNKLQNRLLTTTANLFTGLRLTDEATCYKMFRREVIQGIALEEERFGFCPEITVKVSKMGLEIREVPISYHARSHSAGKKLRLRDGLAALRCLFKYSRLQPGPSRWKTALPQVSEALARERSGGQ